METRLPSTLSQPNVERHPTRISLVLSSLMPIGKHDNNSNHTVFVETARKCSTQKRGSGVGAEGGMRKAGGGADKKRENITKQRR